MEQTVQCLRNAVRLRYAIVNVIAQNVREKSLDLMRQQTEIVSVSAGRMLQNTGNGAVNLGEER